MIGRNPAAAARERYDVIIVGGGIYGVTLALEAARRGVRPLLLERGDFGGETSWNSLRIVHGGLRYLQSIDLRRFRESVEERSWMLREFPDLVSPLPCLLPLDGRGLRRPAVLRAALLANDLLSRHRNDGLPPDRRLGGGRVLSLDETLRVAPGVKRAGLCGAALWHDGAMPDSQRLIVEMLHWGAACGAVAINYCEAKVLLQQDGDVIGVGAIDREGARELELRAPLVVNCAGPWCEDVAGRFGGCAPSLFRPSLAFNLLLDRPPGSELALAVPLPGVSGGTYFLHPWKGLTLAGTHHAAWNGAQRDAAVEEPLIELFLDNLNRGLPGLGVRREEVLRVHRGLLPARREGTAELAVREVMVDHAACGGPAGLFSVSGVKFTTARRVAENVLRAILARGDRALPAYGALPRPRAGRPPEAAEFESEAERDPRAAALAVQRRIDAEAVVHLDDLILRRTDWGADPRRGRRIGATVARLLGWDDARARDEVRRLEPSLTRR